MSHMKNRDSNRPRREDRQIQAKIRQEAYDKLTTIQKIDKLGSLRALKERAKLVKLLEGEVELEQKGLISTDPNVPVPAPLKEKKGAKAKRQAKKDKKAKE